MTTCPMWKKPQPDVVYLGSASRGLGFYHVELPEAEATRWLNINNYGVVVTKKGDLTLAALEREFSEIFC